jgi:dTMP kinase
MDKKPYFITIEGIEGVGKTTLAKLIEHYFIEKGYHCELTREPGGTDLAEAIRMLLKNRTFDVDAVTELLLMFAARSHHIYQKIKPLLEQGVTVISDRFVDASYAYQGGGRGIDDADIQNLDNLVCGSLKPDYTILVTCPVEIAMQRVLSRLGDTDRIEQEKYDFFEKAQDKYISIAKNDSRYILIDGSLELAAVEKNLLIILQERIAL